jgi:hypothetical protein
MLDKNGDQAGTLGGSVEHSEGKGGESAVAILRIFYVVAPTCVS